MGCRSFCWSQGGGQGLFGKKPEMLERARKGGWGHLDTLLWAAAGETAAQAGGMYARSGDEP